MTESSRKCDRESKHPKRWLRDCQRLYKMGSGADRITARNAWRALLALETGSAAAQHVPGPDWRSTAAAPNRAGRVAGTPASSKKIAPPSRPEGHSSAIARGVPFSSLPSPTTPRFEDSCQPAYLLSVRSERVVPRPASWAWHHIESDLRDLTSAPQPLFRVWRDLSRLLRSVSEPSVSPGLPPHFSLFPLIQKVVRGRVKRLPVNELRHRHGAQNRPLFLRMTPTCREAHRVDIVCRTLWIQSCNVLL